MDDLEHGNKTDILYNNSESSGLGGAGESETSKKEDKKYSSLLADCDNDFTSELQDYEYLEQIPNLENNTNNRSLKDDLSNEELNSMPFKQCYFDIMTRYYNNGPDNYDKPSKLPNLPTKKRERNPEKIIYYNQQQIDSNLESENEEDEGLNDYKINGYHPVHIGEILLERYIILQKLGWGLGSTTWMAMDAKYRNYVAIKIEKSAQQNIDEAYDEVEILTEIEKHNYDKEWVKSVKEYWKNDENYKSKNNKVTKDNSQVLQLLNSFIYQGQNGKHFCLVFEIMGMSLSEVMKKFKYKGMPIEDVKKITKQILIGLDYIHRICGIIHTDLTPENIWMCLSPKQKMQLNNNDSINIKKVKQKKNKQNKKKEETNTSMDCKINEIKANNKKKSKKNKQSNNDNNQKNIKPISNNKKYQDLNDDSYNSFTKALKSYGKKLKDIIEYDVFSLIKRPRTHSAPKKIDNYFENSKDTQKDNNEQQENEYDISIMEYEKNIKNYVKEIKKLNTNFKYKAEVVIKQVLSETLTEEQEKTLLKSLQYDYNVSNLLYDNENIKVKICHFTGACYVNKHFTKDIQTRQYRAPEVILGVNYNEKVDIWSLACIVFELITGDCLFDPRKKDSKYSKDDDHLAQCIELLGKIPKNFALSGTEARSFFTKDGKLGRIETLHKCSLYDVLRKKYHLVKKEAKALTDFLLPMLEYRPEKRASARAMLKHPWLKCDDNSDIFMSESEIEKFNMIEECKKEGTEENSDNNFLKNSYEEDEADEEDNDNYDENDNYFTLDDYREKNKRKNNKNNNKKNNNNNNNEIDDEFFNDSIVSIQSNVDFD